MSDLREYTAMKYIGDCKCGKCQLVPRHVLDEHIVERDALVKALRDIIDANKEFRAGMPDGWEGDPLQDACTVAERLLAAVGETK